MPDPHILDRHFPRFAPEQSRVPVWCLTPGLDGCLHRFFMTNPLSPNGRLLAVTRFLQEDQFPEPGEQAEMVVIDLETGEKQVLGRTAGWEPQMGANPHWGNDTTLYWNDVERLTWKPVTVRCDLRNGGIETFGRGLYAISPDGALLACASLEKMRRTQRGYGVVIPDHLVPMHTGFPDDDGLWITDTHTGEVRLALSLREILERLGTDGLQIPDAEQGHAYGFHCQFNADGSRLMFTLRWVKPGHPKPWDNIGGDMHFVILTCRPDGGDPHAAVPASYWAQKPGHHTRWMPDGQHLSMNLTWPPLGSDHLTLVRAKYDGSVIEPILEQPYGSGHPTVHPNGNILTDTYTWEGPKFGAPDGCSVIRWIDVSQKKETTLVEIPTAQRSPDGALRVDPHVAFDSTRRFATFNGFTEGTRRVFLADLGEFAG